MSDEELQRAQRLGRASARAGRPVSSCPFDASGDDAQRLLALRFVRGYVSVNPGAVDYTA